MRKTGFFSLIMLSMLLWISSVAAEDTLFSGFWIGSLRVMEMELEIHVEIEETDKSFKGSISIPDQLLFDHPLDGLKIDYPEVEFVLDAGAIVAFRGSMKEGFISGTFTQAGINGLFHLVPGDKERDRKETIELGPLEGEREVSIETPFGRIYGSLTVPSGKERYPCVLIVAGSGPTDRDGNNPLIPGKGYVYRQIAEELQSLGIASLRYDKRGIGESSGALRREEDLRIDYYIQDVVKWVEFLRKEESVSQVIIFGHSEGSLLGIIASQKTETDGFISAAGAGRNFADVLTEQFARQPEPYKSEGISIIESLRDGRIVQDVSSELATVFRPSVQPFLVSALRFDPSAEIGKLNIPILIIQGNTDLQTTVEDAELLAGGNEEAELVIIDRMNHMFRTASDDLLENVRTYGDPELPLADGFMSSVVEFIRSIEK